jgi:hypothetical protein
MLALLGSFLGFASSLLPDVFTMFRDKKDKAHELAILRMQMEMMDKRRSNRMAEIRAEADASESQYIYKFAVKSGNPTMDVLSTSVRPVLSYAFFILYASIKIAAFLILQRYNNDTFLSLSQIWSDEDQTIFCAIISFWFGHRAFRRKQE